jgi:hypothetical protein
MRGAVYACLAAITAVVILSSMPDTWAAAFALRDKVAPSPDVLAERRWNDARRSAIRSLRRRWVADLSVYMLDTDTASYVVRGGRPHLDERIAAVPVDDVCISAVTRAELLYGVRLRPGAERLARLVRAFLSKVRAGGGTRQRLTASRASRPTWTSRASASDRSTPWSPPTRRRSRDPGHHQHSALLADLGPVHRELERMRGHHQRRGPY